MIALPFAKKHGVLIRKESDQSLTVLFSSPPTLATLAEIKRTLNQPFQLKRVTAAQFNDFLVAAHQVTTNTDTLIAHLSESTDLKALLAAIPETEDLLNKQHDAPIIHLINALFQEALQKGASDIHIEPFEHHIAIRFRIDGLLREVLSPPRVIAPLVISRIKVMAKLDIAEKRLPQDGRIRLMLLNHGVDVRVSIIPTNHGERAVLRLLDQKTTPLDLDSLGMDPETQIKLRALIKKPNGILLVTGPTGSGKTTTLYALLTLLNDKKRNILTIEDPVEYALPGIGQTQVNLKTNMTFSKGLRAILRQDPDIVMIGEIRDLETAQIAIQASLTGHLVLSTLHTNSATGAITRLIDMGIEPFLLASSLAGVLSERLIRLLCTTCKTPLSSQDALYHTLNITPGAHALFTQQGCPLCNQTGYQGRSGIYELITMDATIRQMIHERANEDMLNTYAHQHAVNLREDGMRRVKAGETTIEEIWRVT